MNQYSLYDLSTGIFTGRLFTMLSARDLEANTPAGCGAVEGLHDQATKRVDLETGAVIDIT